MFLVFNETSNSDGPDLSGSCIIFFVVFLQAQAGLTPITQLLQTIQTYENEENPYVWNNLIENLLKLSSLLVHTEYFEGYRKFIIKLCKPFSVKIGWEIKENEGILSIIKYMSMSGKSNFKTYLRYYVVNV